jgi:hypothetical protein
LNIAFAISSGFDERILISVKLMKDKLNLWGIYRFVAQNRLYLISSALYQQPWQLLPNIATSYMHAAVVEVSQPLILETFFKFLSTFHFLCYRISYLHSYLHSLKNYYLLPPHLYLIWCSHLHIMHLCISKLTQTFVHSQWCRWTHKTTFVVH